MEQVWKRIVCAVDFSPLSDEVVAYAAELQLSGGELTLLHVENGEDGNECLLKKHLHAFSHYSDILARRAGKAVFRVLYGDPATEILSCAAEQEADLLVLGSHGSMAFTRLLMGSTAETVMRRATCPVIIYKSPETGTPARERTMSKSAVLSNDKKQSV